MRSAHEERPRTDHVTPPSTWLLHGARPFCAWMLRRRYTVRVHGTEHFPTTGPVVVAANHIGIIDGPVMAIYAPRPVHAMTKQEMFTGFLGRFLGWAGQIPLDRMHADPRAVRFAVRCLREGRVVGIFPEGTRGSGELEIFHRGAAYLALTVGAPIVPLMIFGTREPGGSTSSLPNKRGVIDLVFCAPFAVDAVSWPRTRDHVGETSRLLRARMLADLEEALASTGRSLPGPLPAGQHEPDPGGGVTEKTA